MKTCYDCQAQIEKSTELVNEQNKPLCLTCAESLLRRYRPPKSLSKATSRVSKLIRLRLE